MEYRLGKAAFARLVIPILAIGAPQAANAQAQTEPLTPSTVDDVSSRSRPEYDAPGILYGPITFAPSLATDVGYDSNLYNVQHGAIADGYVELHPKLVVSTNPGQLSSNLSLSGNIDRYFSQTSENSNQYDFDNTTGYTFGDTILTATGGYGRHIESRGSSGDIFAGGSPVTYRLINGALTVDQTLGRLRITLSGTGTHYGYEAVHFGDRSLSQSLRDLTQWGVTGKLTYSVGPGLAVFTSVSHSNLDYSHAIIRGSDVNGLTILAGVDFGVTRLLTGTVAGGYIHESFRSDQFATISGATYQVNLKWNPTTLLSFKLDGSKTLQRSPLLDVAGILETTLTFGADYELLRNLILSAKVTFEQDKYQGSASHSDRFSGTLSARYLVSRGLEFTVSAGGRTQSATGPLNLRTYSGFSVMSGITVRR